MLSYKYFIKQYLNRYLFVIGAFIIFTIFFSSLTFCSQLTDLVNVTKYHAAGYKGQGVKCVIIDSEWGGWSTLKDQGIVKDGHAWQSIAFNVPLPDNPTGSGHGASMIQAFHEMAPEAEIYLYDDTVGLQGDNLNLDRVLDYFRTEGISLVSHSLNSVNCDADCASFLTGNDGLSLLLDQLGSSVTVCAIAGNYANRTSFFHLVKDPGSNIMLFPNGTQNLDIEVLPTSSTSPFNIVITRSGFRRAPNYQYVLTNETNRVMIENGANKPVVTSIDVARDHVNVGDILRLNIVRIADTVDELDIIIGDFDPDPKKAPKWFKLQNPAEMNKASSIAYPGASKKAITTGAILVSDYNKRDVISSRSGWGPIPQDVDAAGKIVVSSYIKPELCAPSEGGATSPTAPRVAGALAVLASAGLCDLSKPEETKNYLLANHVVKIQPSPNNTFGYGRLFLDAKIDWPPPVLPTPSVDSDGKDILVYPNPVSLSANNYLNITSIPLEVTKLDARIYNINGEFIKSFSILELADNINKKMLRWDLRNENGDKVAPGVYFITIKTDSTKIQIKKFAIQK